MTPTGLRVLQTFNDLRKEKLDLHALFEAGGNEPASRNDVVTAVDELVAEGLLESCGGDFYALTEKGKRTVSSMPSSTGAA